MVADLHTLNPESYFLSPENIQVLRKRAWVPLQTPRHAVRSCRERRWIYTEVMSRELPKPSIQAPAKNRVVCEGEIFQRGNAFSMCS